MSSLHVWYQQFFPQSKFHEVSLKNFLSLYAKQMNEGYEVRSLVLNILAWDHCLFISRLRLKKRLIEGQNRVAKSEVF